MWNLIYDTNEPIYETETESGTQRIGSWLPRDWGWEREVLGVWDQQMQTGVYRMDQQKGPTVEHRELYSESCDKP